MSGTGGSHVWSSWGVKSGPFVEVLFRMMDTMGVRWSSARPVRGPRRDHRSHYNRVDPTWATNGTNEETGPDGGEAGNRRSAVRGEGVPPARGGRRRGTGDVPQRALPGRRAASADDPSPAAHPRGARVHPPAAQPHLRPGAAADLARRGGHAPAGAHGPAL